MSASSPIRYPDLRSRQSMTTRAWWLVVLNFVLPGSAQLLAGSRRLGRFGVVMTFIMWVLVAAAAAVYFLNKSFIMSLATNVWALLAAEIVLVVYAVLWLVLTLDTLRLVRLVKTGPAARPFIAVLAIVGLVASAGTAAYGANVVEIARSTISSVFDSGEYEEPVDGRYNVLLLGGDAGPDRMGLRPDSISVASVHAETGATTIIGLPRNFERAVFSEGSPLYQEFPNGYDCGDDCLISYLYTEGINHPDLYPDAEANGSNPGIEAMRDAVEGVTGLQLQYYVLIDMQGFSDLIDALGGVSIEVPERTPIGPVTAPTPYGYVEAGPQHLDGPTALWYARSRFESSDYERMLRQRQVQAAILEQFEPANVLTRFQAVADAGAQVVKTDIPQVMLGLFTDLATKSRALPLTTLEIIPPDFDTLNPDYEFIHARIQESLVAPEPPE
ncbi:LCP family protein [Homoserinimonas sp. A520]